MEFASDAASTSVKNARFDSVLAGDVFTCGQGSTVMPSRKVRRAMRETAATILPRVINNWLP